MVIQEQVGFEKLFWMFLNHISIKLDFILSKYSYIKVWECLTFMDGPPVLLNE